MSIEITVSIDLVCDDCGDDLETQQLRQLTKYAVTPCKICMALERAEGVDEGKDIQAEGAREL